MTDRRDLPDDPRESDREGLTERIERGVEQTVERVGEAVERVEEKVEHAVEEVVEEVVEHVPEPIRAPVRWTVQKLVLAIGVGILAALLIAVTTAAYYIWNHTEWAAHELTWRVNLALRAHSDVELTVDDVRGNPLSVVQVVHPRVRFRSGDGPPVLEARSMTLRYSTWNLFTGKRGAVVMELERPVIRLERGAGGKLRLPTWRPGPTAARPGRGFDFDLRIREADMLLPEAEHSIQDLDLEAAVATGGPTSVEIRSLSWKRGPHGLALEKLRGSVTAADSVVLRVAELHSGDLEVRGEARWKRGEGARLVEAEIERVRWRWIARVFRNSTFDVPGEGAFSIRAREEGGWTGTVRSRASWNGLPLEAEGRFALQGSRLTLDPLRGRSPAGVLTDGRLHWSRQGWDITGTAQHADPAHWSVIGLDGWPAGNLNGRFRYAVDTRGQPDGELDARLTTTEWAGWRADSGEVRVNFPPGAPDSFHVLALRRGGRVALMGRAEAGGWKGRYRVTGLPLDEWPDGRASGIAGTLGSGEGTVEGREGGLWVTGTLEGRSTRWLGMDAALWRLDGIHGKLLPTVDLEAQVLLRSALYLGVRFDSAASASRLGDRTLELAALTAWAGDTVVTMTLGADWGPGSWRLVADQARAQSRRFDWRAQEPIRVSGNAEGVTFERLVAADGEARLEVQGRWALPGGSYHWHGRAERLRLERLGLPDDLGLGGVADAELAVTGAAGDPRWELRAACSGPARQGRRADSLRIALAGAPSRLEVRELALGVGGGWIAAEGQVSETAHAWPDSLTPQGVVRWLAEAGRWSARARVRELPLDRWTRLAGGEAGWSGRLEGDLELGGRPSRPELEASLRARPLAWRNLRLDEVVARGQYRDDRLRVEQLRATREAVVSDVTGEMELKLALGRRPEPLDAPMSWRVDLPNGDLALLALLVPQIGSASGRFVVQGQVRGTPRRPELDGTARIEDGRLRFAGREEILESVRARFTFAASRVSLDSLTAVQRTRQGEPGRVWARGVVQLPDGQEPSYRFDVSLRDFTAMETGFYAARFDGDFQVVNGKKLGRQTLPHVTSDNVEVHRAVILYDFAGRSEAEQVEASTQPLFWTYRLRVRATDNLRWQPPDGDIEFSADLNLEQTPERLVILGDMESLRGTYYFLSNRFTVERARLTFDDVGGVDPLVDAEATTQLVASYVSSQDPGTPPRYTITVRVQGRASSPTVGFESQRARVEDPELDQAQILRELTVGRFFIRGETVADALTDPLDSYLTRAINRQLSEELSRAFRGYLSEWQIARESGGVLGEGGVIVGVGSQLNQRLALRYRQRLPGTGRVVTSDPSTTLLERDIEAEYRLSRFFYISSQLAQKRSAAGSSSGVSNSPDFNINLKARWEY